MSIKLVEDYNVIRKRNYTRESLQNHGEQAILLSMYHADDDVACPYCADDIYDGGLEDCTHCFGTGFLNGVKAAVRVWAMFTDHQVAENYSQRGVWKPDAREIQTEAFPQLGEHDFVVRVRIWGENYVPLELEGFYAIQAVTQESLRTGGRFGQFYWDVTGQRANVTKVSEATVINKYPILGRAFPEFTWSVSSPSAPIVTQPDQKIVVLPRNNKFVALLGDGTATVFPVVHNLGTSDVDVVVRIAATGELVDPDVFVTDANTVTVDFGSAPSVDEYRVVVLS